MVKFIWDGDESGRRGTLTVRRERGSEHTVPVPSEWVAKNTHDSGHRRREIRVVRWNARREEFFTKGGKVERPIQPLSLVLNYVRPVPATGSDDSETSEGRIVVGREEMCRVLERLDLALESLARLEKKWE